jgi:hypothetical protein
MSGNEITSCDVSVYDKKYTLTGIKKNEWRIVLHDIGADAHYAVRVELESGAVYEHEFGYITSGADFLHSLTVTSQGIIAENEGFISREPDAGGD